MFSLNLNDTVFQEAKPPGDYYKIGQLMREQPHLKVKSNEEGVEMVLHHNMAFIKVNEIFIALFRVFYRQ